MDGNFLYIDKFLYLSFNYLDQMNDFLGNSSKVDKNKEIEDVVFLIKMLCKYAEKEFSK